MCEALVISLKEHIQYVEFIAVDEGLYGVIRMHYLGKHLDVLNKFRSLGYKMTPMLGGLGAMIKMMDRFKSVLCALNDVDISATIRFLGPFDPP